MRLLLAVLALAVLALTVGAACQHATRGTTTPASATVTTRTRCERAWQDFAAIDDFHDRVRAAVPTLRACPSLKEWIQVGRATPGHRLVAAKITAMRMCRYEEGVQSAPVCGSL